MAKRQTTEAKVARLKALRDEAYSPAALAQLKKALLDRSNYVVARAAEIIGEFEIKDLVPDLLTAFDRFLIDSGKTDPQCQAKTATAETLRRMEYDNREFYLKGMSYVQLEPVWGRQQDSAAQLRGICALGLVRSTCPDPVEVLNHLVVLLNDPERPARVDAARAVGDLARREATPLLRLKILTGDTDPAVVGACFSALLSLSAKECIPFVAEFLDSPDPDICLEAATALGECRQTQAFEALQRCWMNHADPSFKQTVLISIGLSRLPLAMDFLLSLVQEGSLENAADAIAALAPCRFSTSVRDKVEVTVRQRGQASLLKAFEGTFGRL